MDPDGKFAAEPVRHREAILYADVDPALLRGPRWQLDVAGHYGRPDVFRLSVDRTARPMVSVTDAASTDGAQAVGGSEVPRPSRPSG